MAVDGARAVILSVKPQQLEWVLSDLQGKIDPDSVVLSIIAGAPMAMIAEGLDHKSVVRAMPNTPAQIGEGISVWTALPDVTPKQLEMARNILAALGQEIEVDEEYYLDMATALSGSGPAYIYLFMEAMIDAGVHLGFPRRIAEQLVVQTLRGSVDYYEMKKSHPAHLRNEVTSPGAPRQRRCITWRKRASARPSRRAIWRPSNGRRNWGEAWPASRRRTTRIDRLPGEPLFVHAERLSEREDPCLRKFRAVGNWSRQAPGIGGR